MANIGTIHEHKKKVAEKILQLFYHHSLIIFLGDSELILFHFLKPYDAHSACFLPGLPVSFPVVRSGYLQPELPFEVFVRGLAEQRV